MSLLTGVKVSSHPTTSLSRRTYTIRLNTFVVRLVISKPIRFVCLFVCLPSFLTKDTENLLRTGMNIPVGPHTHTHRHTYTYTNVPLSPLLHPFVTLDLRGSLSLE